MEVLNCGMFLREVTFTSAYCWILCNINLHVQGQFESQFAIYMWLLKQRFKLINKFLMGYSISHYIHKTNLKCLTDQKPKVIESPSVTLPKLLECRKLHEDLCEIGQMVNASFAVQILITVCNNFIGFTTLAYYCFDGFSSVYIKADENHDVYNIVTTFLWAVSKLVQVAFIAIICSKTTIAVRM